MKRPKQTVGTMRPLNIVIAVDYVGGFAREGKIPWYFPEDLKHFKQTTTGGACIMGRVTYQDMYDMVIARKSKGDEGEKKKPVHIEEILPKRDSYVVTRTMNGAEGATVVPDIRAAVERTSKNAIFVIGGERMFIEALPWVNRIYMTIVKGTYDCDRFFPVDYVQQHFRIIKGKKKSPLTFVEYVRK